MTAIAAIRTNHWGEDAQRLYSQLAPVWGERLVVVFHNRPEGLELPLPVVDINDAWVEANGLRVLPDWGWRCGDYCLYALRQAYPEADHFWLIEPDVYFKGDVGAFFDRFAARSEDCLGVSRETLPSGHLFSRSYEGHELQRAIFALVRFSARALDALFVARRDYLSQRLRAAWVMNDEYFCFTWLRDSGRFQLASLADLAPDLVRAPEMRTDPDMLLEGLPAGIERGVFHPVRTRASFKTALARRLAVRGSPFGLMLEQIKHLETWEIEAVSSDIADQIRDAMLTLRQRELERVRRHG